MISVIINDFNDIMGSEKTVESLLEQDFIGKIEVIITSPSKEVLEYLKGKFGTKIKYDLGESKSALNKLIYEVKGDIIVCTNSEVYLDKSAVRSLVSKFKEGIGVVSGRSVSTNSKDNMLGYWSHLLFDIGGHLIFRKKRYERGEFLECSEHFFSFRKDVTENFPTDVARESIIPYLFYKKGFKISYAEDAYVYVKNPENFSGFVEQRKKRAESHYKLKTYAPDFPRIKSFSGEIKGGLSNLIKILFYAKSLKQFAWTLFLFPTKLYVWSYLFHYFKFKKDEYVGNYKEN